MIENVIILAAGLGKRMSSDLPKCACAINNKPMIQYIIETCRKIKIKNIVIVVGYKKEIIKNIFKNDKDVLFAFQKELTGTATACLACLEILKGKKGNTLIIPGDMPLIKEETLISLINFHEKNNNDLTILSAHCDNPFGYGRIIRNKNKVVKITEEKDATIAEKNINEINTGVYIINNELLFDKLKLIKNNNAQKEFYLTDIVQIIGESSNVDAMIVEFDFSLSGINDQRTLKNIEEKIKGRS